MRGHSTRDRLRWDPITPERTPTAADLASSVYRVTYQPDGSANTFSFCVLALDADHAKEVGDAWLEAQGGDPSTEQLIRTEHYADAPLMWASLFQHEPAEVWQDRQGAYAARQQAIGGSGNPL